eukprot:scaffold933_cov190-Alexandrium_tamarense.AAC.23
MDLLSSLGLQNDLPEQSTRLSHPGVLKALNNDDDARIGFNCCCNCGTTLLVSGVDDSADVVKQTKSKKQSGKFVTCMGCKRVRYCSDACCKADAEATPPTISSDADETACGHSPVICSLLRLCNDDEDAEGELYDDDDGKSQWNKKKKMTPQQERAKEASKYRVQTERESYPATLFNILAEGPGWFMEAITRRVRYLEDPRSPEVATERRGKRDRMSNSPKKPIGAGSREKDLVIHIVGASVDSELWGWKGRSDNANDAPVLEAYAEASTNILAYLKSFPILLDSVRLVFVGPDCQASCKCEVPIPDSKSTLIIETHQCNYGEESQYDSASSLPPADCIVFFNPGFSCPDYNWTKALETAATPTKIGNQFGCGTPFLVTTNTEMEGFADIKCLLDMGCIDAKNVPGDVLEAVDHSARHTDGEDTTFFFNENPYAGLRVRQSGTMANDLYVKNRWILGGLFKSTDKINKRKSEGNLKADDVDEICEQVRKRHRADRDGSEGGGGNKNSKKTNSALI